MSVEFYGLKLHASSKWRTVEVIHTQFAYIFGWLGGCQWDFNLSHTAITFRTLLRSIHKCSIVTDVEDRQTHG